MIAFLLFLLIFGMPSAFVGGILVQRRVGIDYKRRWQEALDTTKNLIDEGIIEKKTVIEKKVVHTLPEGVKDPGDDEIRQRLRKLPGWSRQESEIKRLKRGLHPVDDLKGLAAWQYQDMVDKRYKYGYDELGRSFRDRLSKDKES
jgi:hypothetical protein